MAWLPEFGAVLVESARLAGVASPTHSPEAVEAALRQGDPLAVLDAFPDGVRIDDPGAGRIEGRDALRAYGQSSAAWLADRRGRGRLRVSTIGPTRVVGEYELDLTQDGRTLTLPVAVVAEPGADARRIWIRIYHSQWPLLGHHVLRPPLLTVDPMARESDVVGEYQTALGLGDAARCVATFEPDGCFREPAGDEFRVCGTADLTEFYTRFFSAGGGIVLEHCTATEDGVRTALEFNAIRWGGVALPPQAGVAVYERGATGRIAAARVYDDVQGPVE